MALAAERNTPARSGQVLVLGVAAAKKIWAGSLVCLSATGYATPGAAATTLKGIGRAKATVDNSAGDAGDLSVEVEVGVFRFNNSADADEITIAERQQVCFVVDDQTVAKTNGGATRSRAGFIVDVDDQGVWVLLGLGLLDAPAGSLAAANNLSDVAAAATAFANIKQAATTAATGVSELATSAETLTGTDTVRTVTPKGAADTYASKITASIVVGAEAGDAINIAIQLKDAAGADLAVRGSVHAYFSDDANGDSVVATAFDTVAIGTDGLAIPLVAGKCFLLTSEADGDIDINVGESAAVTKYLILVMPDGRLVASGAITFA